MLDRYGDVVPYISAVSDASDTHRDLLGFFPRGVFDEFARRDDLFMGLRDFEWVTFGHFLIKARATCTSGS